WGDMSASSKLAQSHAFVSAEGTQCQSKCFTQQGLGMTNTSTVRCGSCMGNSGFFEECSCSVHYLVQRCSTSICSRVSKNIYFPRLKAIQQQFQSTVHGLCANFIALPAENFRVIFTIVSTDYFNALRSRAGNKHLADGMPVLAIWAGDTGERPRQRGVTNESPPHSHRHYPARKHHPMLSDKLLRHMSQNQLEVCDIRYYHATQHRRRSRASRDRRAG